MLLQMLAAACHSSHLHLQCIVPPFQSLYPKCPIDEISTQSAGLRWVEGLLPPLGPRGRSSLGTKKLGFLPLRL